jgi:homoserine kinase type II
MAQLTPLPPDEARAIGARFGVHVERVEGILAGSVNSNFALIGPSGERTFLRVYEEQTHASAIGEAALLMHLASHGVRTPKPLARADGSFIDAHAGKPVALFPWIEGETLCQKRVTEAHARAVGEAVARTHVAGDAYPVAPPSRFDASALMRRLNDVAARPALPVDVTRAVDRLRCVVASFADRTVAPGGLVHGDLFRDNVLWRGTELVALLDFESACRESWSFDLAVTLLAWCFGDALDLTLVRAMLGGYLAARSLTTSDEARLFQDLRFAATRFATTRITDFELRPRGSGVYKDFRRFLARLDAVDALGERGVRALVEGARERS